MRFDAERIFLDTIPFQRAALDRLIDQHQPDAILIDPGFAGAAPLLLRPASGRPPILKAGLTPLMFSSRDTAPFGMKLPPAASALGRTRNRALYALGRRTFRSTERHGAEVRRREGCAAPEAPLFDWA